MPKEIKKCFRLFWGDFNVTSLPPNCTFMTLHTKSPGRCGNRMFRIASLLGIAYRFDFVPILSNKDILVDLFELPNVSNLPVANTNRLIESGCCKYNIDSRQNWRGGVIDNRGRARTGAEIDRGRNWTIGTYLQSWKYFSGVEDVILKAFKIKERFLQKARDFLKNNYKPGVETVGIHVRRGDMNFRSSLRFGYVPANVTYIATAIKFFERTLNQSHFIVVSDDIKWCKNGIKGDNIFYSPFVDYEYDVALLRLCDHMIVTSGTFGWWGGWFVKGMTVYYTGFPLKGSALAQQFNLTDYYPGGWIGIP